MHAEWAEIVFVGASVSSKVDGFGVLICVWGVVTLSLSISLSIFIIIHFVAQNWQLANAQCSQLGLLVLLPMNDQTSSLAP